MNTKKIIFLGLGLSMFAVAITLPIQILFIHLIPSQWLIDKQVWIIFGTLPLSIFVTFGVFAIWERPQNKVRKIWTAMSKIFMTAIVMMYFHFGCFLGISSIILYFSDEIGKTEFHISNTNYDPKRCKPGIRVHEGTLLADSICDININTDRQIKVGDIVCVSGKKNILGIIPESIRIYEKTDSNCS